MPMPEATEIPEAKDPFEKRVAITIALIAVVLSFISNQGDNAKTESILRTTEAANQWAYYQAKSVKQTVVDGQEQTFALFASVAPDKVAALAQSERLKGEAARYAKEKDEIKKKAEALDEEAKHDNAINDRCDKGALFLQLAVVVASVAILTQMRFFWWIGMALGVAGAVIGGSAFWM